MAIKKGDKVKVEYTGKTDDGNVFDSTEKSGTPIDVEIGSGKIIKGFEDALVGMEKGQEKQIKLKPEEAYGEYNPELVKKVPREQFPKEKEPQKGMMLMVSLGDGSQIPATIKDADEKEVTLDLNHPLVGKTLNFDIKVIEVNPA